MSTDSSATPPPRNHGSEGTAPRRRRPARRRVGLGLAVLVVLAALFLGATQVWTDVLWYRQLGFLGVFVTENLLRIGCFLVAAVLMAGAVWGSIRWAWTRRPQGRTDPAMERYQQALEPMRRVLFVLVPLLVGLFAAVSVAAQWDVVVLFFQRVPFGQTDPQFGLDLSFFVFVLPFLRLVAGYLITVLVFSGVVGLVVHYLYGGVAIQESGLRTTAACRRQLGLVAGLLLAVLAGNFWLGRYSTLQSTSGSWTGAMYTDVNAVIPTDAILAVSALLVAVLFVVATVVGRWRLPLVGTAMLLVVSLVAGGIYPWVVQRFQVQPTEQSMEREYIQRNIDMTRQAYGLSDLTTRQYDASVDTGKGRLSGDSQSISNIRLLDPNVVSSAFAQLQQFRPYYQFDPSLTVDRYTVDGRTQDTVIAARELNPSQNQGWYNQHVVYTHGYGVIAAYGNQVESDGKPKFMQSGIDAKGVISQDYEPRIYFGKDSPEYSVVGGAEGTDHLELDRPQSTDAQGASDAKTTFTGNGGPSLGSWFNRLAYSIKYRSSDLLLSDAVRPESQILYDRDPAQRIKKVAPYLTVDGNPYPAIVDGRVQWIVDAYTTSSQYPYSTPTSLGDATQDSNTSKGETQALPDQKVNYIRNSVKATVDAYDGSVKLYAWDDQDPVLKAWQKVFPETVHPYSEMSADLMAHVRYPQDFFKVQRELLNRYHVTDANSFYAGDDVWRVPNDPTESGSTEIPPYYLSLQMPGQKKADFSLTSSFIAQQSDSTTRNVMYGFVAANGDAGTGKAGVKSPDYGKMTLLQLPRSSVVPGPGQAQNSFNSEAKVQTELNLLRQGASQVVNGNLLTLPVGGGILYVQPVYVKSSGDSSYPTLRRVLVGFGDKVGFAPTLDEALNQVFGGSSGADTARDAGVDAAKSDAGGASGSQQGSGSGGDQASVQSHLQEANQAMKDADAAMKSGDWAAYGKAQDRLKTALDQAMQEEGSSATASPSATDGATAAPSASASGG